MHGYREQLNKARLNTRSFLRSLYFQLVIGWRDFRSGIVPEYYAKPIRHRDEVIAELRRVLVSMDRWYLAKEDALSEKR